MLKSVWQSNLAKSAILVASGTAGAQAIGMLFVPFITRTYGPEVYGLLGTFIALTGILTSFSALAYPVAIVLPKSDNAAKVLVKLSLIVSVLISLIVLVILLLSGDWVMTKLGAESLIGFMFFIPLVVFLTSCQDITQQWLIRKKAFKAIAKISIAHSIINYGSQAVIGLYTPLAAVLIGIHSTAIAIRSFFTGLIGYKLVESEALEKLSIKEVAYRYRDFPIFRAPQVVLNAVSQSLPVLMLNAFFGPVVAGFYALTRTVLSLPSMLLGSAVQSVFYPHLNDAVLEGHKTLPLLIKTTLVLSLIGVWPFLIVILFGPCLFEFVFGEEWRQSGQYAQWISVWLFFVLISRPAVSSIAVFKIQKWFLFFEIFGGILRLSSLLVGFLYFNSALLSIVFYSFSGVVVYSCLMVKVFFTARKIDLVHID